MGKRVADIGMLVVCSAVYLVYALELRALPMSAKRWGLLGLFLNVPIFVLVCWKVIKELRSERQEAPSPERDQKEANKPRRRRWDGAVIMGMAAAIAAFAPRIGFVASSVAALPIAMLLLGTRRITVIVFTTAGMFIFLQVIIVGLFHVPLNQ